jgi:PAS domain S-box-containing protein
MHITYIVRIAMRSVDTGLAPVWRHMKILHVDDEPGFRELVSFFLGRQGDFEVEPAGSAEEALQRLSSEKYDAIVIDYTLPGMDGIELLKIVRAQGNKIPIVMFTGKGREDTAAMALNNGADFYLEKGTNPQAHFAELGNMLNQSVRTRRMDEDIAKSERFLSNVFSSIQDGISILDKDLTILRVNSTMERWYAHKSPLVGKKCFDAYHCRDAQCEVCPSLKTIETGKAAVEVVPKVGPGGLQAGWLEVFTFPMIESGASEPAGVIEYVRDVSDRRKAEIELNAALKRYRELGAIIDKSPTILVKWKAEPGSPVSYISAGITRFGYSRDDFVSTFVYDDIIHKEDLERNRREFRERVASGAMDFIQEYRIVTKSGEPRWVEDHTYVKRDKAGRPLEYEGVVIDVTPRKMAQQKSEDLASRLQAIVDAFPDLYFLTSSDGTILEFNAAKVSDLYVPPQKFLGQRMQDVLPLEVGQLFLDAERKISASGKAVSVEYTLEMSGDQRAFEARILPFKRGNLLIVVRDITVRRAAQDALRLSEYRYRQLADSIVDVFFAFDRGMRYTYWNKASEELTGTTAGEAIGKHYSEIFKGPQADSAMSAYLEVLRSRKPKRFQTEYDIGGSRRTFELTAHPTEEGISVIAKDVTERMIAEETLRERDLQFKKLSSHVPGMIYQFKKRPDGTYCVPYTSDAIKGIFGCSPEDVKEDFSPISRVILPADLGKVIESIEGSARDLSPWVCEYRVQVPGKPIRWLFGHSTPERLADGSIVWHGFNADITERKQAEELVRASEEKYRNLVELAQEGIILTDKDSNVVFANRRLTEMLGRTTDEMLGRPVFQFLDESSIGLAKAKIEERKTGISDRYEVTFVKKNGTFLRVSAGVTPVMNEEGRFAGSLAVVSDISDRLRYEEALEAANAKLNLLGHVTRHDALNQLAILVGWLQIAQEMSTEKATQEYLKNMMAAADSIHKQLDFAGDYMKMGVARPRWLRLDEAFQSGVAGLDTEGIQVSSSLKGFEVFADPMLERVFHNLLDNTLRHGGKVTRVTVTSSERKGRLLIVYEDDGVGIPESERSVLFARGHGKHTGFGLFLVREVLTITGITIEEKGEHGKGARFELIVPAGGYRTVD